MPEVGRPEFESEPNVDAIHRADKFIDALAGGRPVLPQDAADAELAALLGSWRDEMRWPPATDLITEADAIAALNAGKAEKRLGSGRDRWTVDTEITPRKNRRGLSVIGAAAAAVLCIGGFGAVVAGAGPGDGLYGLRTMLFGTPKEVRDDQVGLAAKTTLNQVEDLISQGAWTQAQDKLVEVSTQVASIGDEQQKQDLLDQFNNLSAKVVERDPAATAPPGVVYTVPPSAAELVPAVAPSTSAEPSAADATTPANSTAATSTTAATPAPPETSSPAPQTSASVSSSPSVTDSVTASPAPTESAAESAAASSPVSSPESSPVAPSSPSPAAQNQTTTPLSAAAPTTTTAPAGQTTAAATTSAPTTAVPSSGPVSETPVRAAAETAPTAQSAPTTTTVLVPIPAG